MSDQNSEPVSSQDSDMRYFPRWDFEERALYRIDGEKEFFEGKTRDISCAGACIIGGWNVEPDQKVEMTIKLSKKVTIKVNATILWAKINNGSPEMGVAFYDTPDEVKDTILQHAFELDKDKAVNHWFKGWNDS